MEDNENIANEEFNIINIEDKNLIEKVDEYNINQLLMNLFKRLIMKAETQDNKNKQNSDSILSILIEKMKFNYPNFFFSLQEPNDIFGLFYTSMKQLIQEYSTSSNFTETDGFSLLGFFEEEIRNFFQTHPFLLKSVYKSEKEKNNKKEIENKIRDITNLIQENNELMNDIFNEFKNAHTKEKQKYVDYINQQHAKINEIVDEIKTYSFNSLSSEQSYQNFEKFKENLKREQKEKEEEIKYFESLLNKYNSQGDEMTKVLNEYRKYSSMINCLKDEINNS